MATKVLVPLLGEGVEEVTVTKWLKKEGDAVSELEPLLEVNTDKVDTEIPAPASGTVLKILAEEGLSARVGAVLALIGKPGEEVEADSGGVQSLREAPPRGQTLEGRMLEMSDSMHIPQADYVGYLRDLEKTLIIALARLGLAAGQRPGLTGVWIQADVHSRCPRCKPEDRQKPAKIAAIGVRVSGGVTTHGLAVNEQRDVARSDDVRIVDADDEQIIAASARHRRLDGRRE